MPHETDKEVIGSPRGGRSLNKGPLALLTICCCLFVLLSSFAFQSYVMPQLGAADLPLPERVRSPKFGDTEGYGRLAEGILKHGELSRIDGVPILKHMPGLPVLLAASFSFFDSVRPFLVFQILFLFASLYFLLARIRDGFPALALAAVPILTALHPQTIKHSAAVMSDLLFGSILLWVVFALWKRVPGYREFLLAGIVFGIAVYVRESALPFMLLTGLAYVVRDWRKFFGPAAVMACAFVLLLSPWVIRNYLVSDRLIPLTTKSSELFYYYSIPLTTELYSPFGPGFQEGGYDYGKLSETYWREIQTWHGNNAEQPPYDAPGGTSLREEISDVWVERPVPPQAFNKGLENYTSRPQQQLSSFVLKSIALLNKPPILAHLADTNLSSLLTATNIAFYAFHVGVILFGAVLSFSARHNPFVFLPYWIAAQYLQSLFFWSEHRYLMPFYPLLILIALTWYCKQWKGIGPIAKASSDLDRN